MAKWVMPIAIGSALAGCGIADDAGPEPCDPFDAHAQPISLERRDAVPDDVSYRCLVE